MKALIDQLVLNQTLSHDEFRHLLNHSNANDDEYLFLKAREITHQIFQNKIYIRGLIEISNYCKNDCLYCGIRNSNHLVKRYRLLLDDIMECCEEGFQLGFRTFVLQSGEDLYYNDEIMCKIISEIRTCYPSCAITLSLGEKDKASYQKYFDAGANRYLLRHETISDEHYCKLHPNQMKLKTRIDCLKHLKEIGFQVGTGIMVGSPFQEIDTVINDLYFIKSFEPQMVGIGPYLPHKDTPFHNCEKGSLELCLRVLAIIRIMNPFALIPATTALSTIHEEGREKGILVGANVVMPNLSPLKNREDYALYDNKACMNAEAKEGLQKLKDRINKIGYEIVNERGDFNKESI